MDNKTAPFEILPWHPLTEFPRQESEKSPGKSQGPVPAVDTKAEATKANPHGSSSSAVSQGSTNKTPSDSAAKILLHDTVCYLYSSIRERMNRCKFSARVLEKTKHELITTGMVLEVTVGKTKYLIPKPLVFEQEGVVCPYRNIEFVKHSFLLGLGAHIIEHYPTCKRCDLEYKIGTKGHTGDIVAHMKDDTLRSFEVTLSTGNIVQNAQKYDGTAFTHITFLCETYDMARTVQSKLKQAQLPADLLGKLSAVPFSALLKKNK